ncbi:hypothetical protein ZIOFF_012052 [Zingiber officinale]|uniref:F-box domain-containing protein n=1 Tax=Zingiber officinale TaxID=94328 RepID=A0A8J5HRR8_ZINOF|nr:hypothetical protein ZIOFF_012052 [Zingiber officinale]
MSLETMTRKKGRRFPGERTTMESLPDDMLRRILSRLCDARDVAACSPVSRRWREATAFIPSLHFLSNALQGGGTPADADILRMVSAAASSLEDLVIHCPFSGRSLASCLALCGQSLRSLDLRVDLLDGGLDCVSLAKGLESLKLWHPSLISSPNWGLSAYGRLRRLEMVGGMVLSEHLADVMRACPHLTDLILIRCCSEGAISIELERLERCKLDLYLTVHCSLNLNSPRLQDLDIQGFFRIQVGHNHRLKRLSIANNEGEFHNTKITTFLSIKLKFKLNDFKCSLGNVTMVDVGKLPELEYLSIEGQHWYWSEIRTLLRNAIEVELLVINIEYSGDFLEPETFPAIQLEEFFGNHRKLRKLEIHGAFFAAFQHGISPEDLELEFMISSSLEELIVAVSSPLHLKEKANTLEYLLKHCVKLRRILIRISQMVRDEKFDDFFEDIGNIRNLYCTIIHIDLPLSTVPV